jgi:hypothetical protein
MLALKIIAAMYLLAGFIYAIYVHLIGSERRWWLFPINVIGGPIMVIYIVILSIRGKRLPIDWH